MSLERDSPVSLRITCPKGGDHDIHVLKWEARNQPDLCPVVCVHGLTRRAEDFKRLAATISETRDVYAFTMAGRGESDRLSAAQYRYETYVSDCRHLLKELSLPQVDWVGTSMGGIIGILIAGSKDEDEIEDKNKEKDKVDPIRRLVLNDVGPFIAVEALKELAQHVIGYDGTPFESEQGAKDYCASVYSTYGIHGTPYWDELLATTIVHDEQGVIRLHYDPHIVDQLRNPASIVAPFDIWMYYDNIKAPTLTLRGADSHLLPPDIAAEMMRHGPKTTVTTFSGCGHAPALVFGEQIGAVAGFLAA